jgi:hypothetical protein
MGAIPPFFVFSFFLFRSEVTPAARFPPPAGAAPPGVPPLAIATFQDLDADVLGGGFDLLHLLAHPRPGGLVPADGFGDVFLPPSTTRTP